MGAYPRSPGWGGSSHKEILTFLREAPVFRDYNCTKKNTGYDSNINYQEFLT